MPTRVCFYPVAACAIKQPAQKRDFTVLCTYCILIYVLNVYTEGSKIKQLMKIFIC